ncbi:MAG: NAD(P)H-dependent oxidoreductase [Proteobacteria bacterium]|nr:NAD(P)H-dependent oxidoreductase [Pseudomonadota bacterium]
MSEVSKILGISGSLRAQSFNTALLHSARGLMPSGATLEVATLHGIPLYDGDVEQRGIPQAVTALKERVVQNQGLLLVTPEYNNSIPGVFKNAIDWLSRPPGEGARIFGGRPVALIGASPGGFGTILSQNAWLPVLHTLGARVFSGARLMASRADKTLGTGGDALEAALGKQLQEFLQKFVEFVRK